MPKASFSMTATDQLIIVLLFFLLGMTPAVKATLIDNGDGTITQIKDDPLYGDGSLLMWLKNSNASAGSSLDNGSDPSDGRMTYANALAWIDSLNAINYLGYSDWRLPRNLPVDGVAFNYAYTFDGSSDNSYNIRDPNAELSYLYYVELGNIGQFDANGVQNPGWFSGLLDMGPFVDNNVGTGGIYWSSEAIGAANGAFYMYFRVGEQRAVFTGNFNSPWAVRDCPECGTIQVQIDIKPGSDANSINLGSHGLIPVAIFSNAGFDATEIDADTVELAGSSVAVRGKGNKLMASTDDVNGDGFIDLVIHVSTINLDPEILQSGTATLIGNTETGKSIEGSDSITLVPPE